MPKKGFKQSDEQKNKISKALKGRPKSNDHKRKAGLLSGISRKGKKYPYMFRKMTEEQKQKISEAKRGEKNWKWTGDAVGYSGLHSWIRKVLGSAKKCSVCGKEGKGREMNWANKDHKYRRIIEDFIELCIICRWKYDQENNLRKSK